nr:uncharacterized protein LOC127309976 [Lolium perenne]
MKLDGTSEDSSSPPPLSPVLFLLAHPLRSQDHPGVCKDKDEHASVPALSRVPAAARVQTHRRPVPLHDSRRSRPRAAARRHRPAAVVRLQLAKRRRRGHVCVSPSPQHAPLQPRPQQPPTVAVRSSNSCSTSLLSDVFVADIIDPARRPGPAPRRCVSAGQSLVPAFFILVFLKDAKAGSSSSSSTSSSSTTRPPSSSTPASPSAASSSSSSNPGICFFPDRITKWCGEILTSSSDKFSC